jgi:anti-anti-sigma factor
MKTALENNDLTFNFEESLISTTVYKLRQVCQHELEQNPDVNAVKVDLSQVEMIDSLGLNFLVSFFSDVSKRGNHFEITGISESNRKLFEMVNLQAHMKLN